VFEFKLKLFSFKTKSLIIFPTSAHTVKS